MALAYVIQLPVDYGRYPAIESTNTRSRVALRTLLGSA
jgi:hypothetical protein